MLALLYYDFFRLERQRAVLDDELVATKEELLFIRAQLQVRFHLHVCVFSSGVLIETFLLKQSKSGRISELEMELMEARRQLMGPSDCEEEDDDLDGEASGDVEGGGEEEKGEVKRALLDTTPPVAAVLSADEAAEMYQAGIEMDLHAQRDAREIELLKNLLVEQEQQVIHFE